MDQMGMNLPEPSESDKEIARRLESIHKRDNLLRQGGRKLRAMRYTDSYLRFGREILDMPLKASFHGEISDRLDKFKNKKHLILGPRGSGKTIGITIAKGLHRAIQNPNIRILLYGETNHNALVNLRAVKNICENNQKFINTFGIMGYTGGPTKWTDEELYFMSRRRSLREPTFMTGGLDTAVTGLHFDLIIPDDMISNKNTQNREQMDKSYETFLTLFPLLDPMGEMWLPGTFWEQYDLYNTILEKHADEFMLFNRGGFGEPGLFDGDAILPEFGLTREFLLAQLNRPGNRARACMWYFGVCVDEEKQPFKESQKKTWNPATEKVPENLSICITVDPASSVSETACDTAMVVAGMDEQSNLWELEHISGKFEPMDTINHLFELTAKWSPNSIGVESASFYNYLRSWLDIEMRKRNFFLPIQPLEGWKQKSKPDRIMMLQPRWAAGALILRSDSQDLMDQFYRYPKGKRIDLLDAFAYQEEIQSSPFIERKKGVYYDKSNYPDLTDNERLIWSRYDPEFQAEKERSEQNRLDALCQ